MSYERVRKFLKILEETYKASPSEIIDKNLYKYGGRRQSKRKSEFIEAAQRIAAERGIPSYNPDRICDELGLGVPVGERFLEPVKVSGTDVLCEYEDLHVLNNAAMQQLRDDIFRTAITCLDLPHRVLTNRYGREVTPETINIYLETINHTLVGGAVAQEHMVEVNPATAPDCYVKAFTGSDELAANLDRRFLIGIDAEFPAGKAEKLKSGVGASLWQVSRLPTHAIRSMDGAMVHRWNAMAQTMAFIAAYRLCAGEAAVSDFAFSAKHAQYVFLGTAPFSSRARGHNAVVGLPMGYIFDIVQHPSKMPDDPVPVTAEGLALIVALYGQWYYGQEMIGSVGVTVGYAISYVNEIFEGWGYYLTDWIKRKYGDIAKAPVAWDVIHECAKEATLRCYDEYDSYPVLQEHHWGLLRAGFTSGMAAVCGAWATGSAYAGALTAHHSFALLQKELALRTGWGGHETHHHNSFGILPSVLLDEGMPIELHGPNVPFRSPFADSQGFTSPAVVAAHEARMDAWSLSPVIKVAFADPDLVFDFRNIRACIAKGALREFMPAGERDPIIPSK